MLSFLCKIKIVEVYMKFPLLKLFVKIVAIVILPIENLSAFINHCLNFSFSAMVFIFSGILGLEPCLSLFSDCTSACAFIPLWIRQESNLLTGCPVFR